MATKKIVLSVIGGLIGLFIIATAYILLVINPNDYKPEIIGQVKSNTGREIVIDGDINWRFLPNIGLTLGKIRINNPEGFPNQPMVQLESAQIELAFWPLLSKKIEIGMISIEGLSLLIHTRKDGVSNLDMPEDVKKDLTEAREEVSGAQGGAIQIKDLVVAGIQVIDAKVIIEDQSAQTKQSIEAINFTLGNLELDKVVPLALSFVADTGDIKATVNSKGKIRIARDLQKFDLIDLNTNITATGESLPDKNLDIIIQMNGFYDLARQLASLDAMDLSILGMDIKGKLTANLANKPNIEYELKTGTIDLDTILTKLPKAENNENEETAPQSIELSWMKSFNMKGLLAAEAIKVANLTISSIKLPMELKAAQLKLSGISAQLYEGEVLANASLDGRKTVPKFPMKTYDYIIIGSGFGGSVSAMRLTEKGYSVLVIERGKRFRDDDFPKSNWNLPKFLWMLKARGLMISAFGRNQLEMVPSHLLMEQFMASM